MLKRVYVVGPSSTGKTTLVNTLAKKLALVEPAVVSEVARDVMTRQGYSREDEDEGRTCAIQICDRSAVDPIVYAILTAKGVEEAQERQNIMVNSAPFQLALKTYHQSIFLLLAPVSEWLIDDGVRLLEHQTQCFKEFQRVLRGLGIDFREIGPEMKLIEERAMFALGLLKL